MILASVSAMAKVEDPKILRTTIVTSWFGLLPKAKESKQLDVREGVILANPARVRAIAEILREHLVQTHTLRLSNTEREKKQGELYSYIVSGRYAQHLDAIDAHAQKLLDLDVAEEKAHRKVWENRGALLKTLQRAEGKPSGNATATRCVDRPGTD